MPTTTDDGAALPATAATIASCVVPGCDATAFIVKAIDGAQAEIRGQAYNFTNAAIIEALLRVRQRGVSVAMLFDKITPCQRGSGADALAVAGIPVMIDARPRIAHNKVLVIDRERVILGSFNFSAGAMRNAEDTNLVGAPAVAAYYLAYWRARQKASTPYGQRGRWCHARSETALSPAFDLRGFDLRGFDSRDAPILPPPL
jgi:phosphatidylserine/phosphatidylglycerophosphate/cardiolipin synthase-like enzyme